MNDPQIQQLLTQPLRWLAAELDRLRTCAVELDALCMAPTCTDDKMAAAIHYLRTDMPRQLADEEVDLLPLLKLRARRDDDLEGIIARLSAGHDVLAAQARQALPRLEALKRVEHPIGADPALAETLAVLATQHRAHLAMVGAVIRPIARLRLTQRDLKVLGQELAARRNSLPT